MFNSFSGERLKMEADTMILNITTQGDRSVGIWPISAKVEISIKLDYSERSEVKKILSEAIERVVDDKVHLVHFDDECPECNRILIHGKKCQCEEEFNAVMENPAFHPAFC